MIGKTISKYKILEKLGEGGMGVVYKAQDLKLDRFVAIKFLPYYFSSDDERKKRFIQEAKTASSLDHPNIGAIYEFDEIAGDPGNSQMFIVMAYYEGETLKDRLENESLPIEKIINITTQVINGLSRAHKVGITHRDIKPANIILTKDDEVKIIDFGLAQRSETSQITKDGETPGTIAYMSPEQLMGDSVDSRTDIWSLGVVLYEMLTGNLPFKGEYEHAVVYSILNVDPEPMTGLPTDVPKELKMIIQKALTKNVDKRYQHIDDMLKDLNRLQDKSKIGRVSERTNKPGKKLYFATAIFAVLIISVVFVFFFQTHRQKEPIDSLAVLPFDNLSTDPEQDVLAAQITDALILELSRISALKSVTSRTSILRYKNVIDKSMSEIAHELDVPVLVEGSVVQHGDSMRIIVQLIDGLADKHIWSNDYTRQIRNIFSLQKEIAQDIANEINIALTLEEKARFAQDEGGNYEAYRLYLLGRYYRSMGTQNLKAKESFERAIEEDPDFASAYTALARLYFFKSDTAKARELISRALELDKNLSDAYVMRGLLKVGEFDWLGGLKELKRAIELDPKNIEARFEYGLYLMRIGKVDDAIAELELTLELDPFSAIASSSLGRCYFYIRQYNKAIEYSTKAINLNPERDWPDFTLIQTFAWQGLYEKAFETLKMARARNKLTDVWGDALEYYIHALSGDYEATLEGIEMFKRNMASDNLQALAVSILYSLMDEEEKALKWLEGEKQQGYNFMRAMVYLHNEPSFNNLRSEPRFQAVLRDYESRIGLVEINDSEKIK